MPPADVARRLLLIDLATGLVRLLFFLLLLPLLVRVRASHG